MFYVYCLESIRNKKLYIGYTENLRRRFSEHNQEQGGHFTKRNGPWKLIFYEAHLDKQDARAMELFYKSGYGREVMRGKLKNYLGE